MNRLGKFCLIIIFSRSLSFLISNKESDQSSLAHAAKKAIGKELKTVNVFTVNSNDHQVNDFKDFFLTKCEFAVRQINLNGNFLRSDGRRMRYSIFSIKDFKSFQNVYKQLSVKSFWLNGFYIFVLVNGEIEEIDEIFELLWKLQIFNVNVMFEDENGSVAVKTFMPFNKEKCDDTKSVKINEFKSGKFTNEIENFFPIKMQNLHGCSIRVGSKKTSSPPFFFIKGNAKIGIEISGRDGNLFNSLAKSLNFKLNFTHQDSFGFTKENLTGLGLSNALKQKKMDVLMEGHSLRPKRAKFFDFTNSFTSEDKIFVVPHAQELSSFEKLIYPFSLDSWIMILVCFGIGFIVIFIISTKSITKRNFVFGTGVRNPYMNVLIGIVGGSQHKLPKRNFARFLLMMFLILTLVLRTLYQGSYFELLKSNKKHKEITTLDELIESKITIFLKAGNEDFDQVSKLFGKR
jgi:hypothetical protein